MRKLCSAAIVALTIVSIASPALACRRPKDWVPPTPEQVEEGFQQSLVTESTEIYLAEVVAIELTDTAVPLVRFHPIEWLRRTDGATFETDGDMVIYSCGNLINSGWYEGMGVGDPVLVFIGSPFDTPRVQHVEPLTTPRANAVIETIRVELQ